VTFLWPRLLLTAGALLPYWRLLTLNVVYITDDYFASDIFNGELPGRALIGQLLRSGHWPVWTTQLCSGLPLAGSPADPLGLALFSTLPPAPALDLYVMALLLVAAHGTFSLARRFGADATGAVLAGLAFAGSGYIACQLKHLAIIATVVWLPVGLLLIDGVFDDGARHRRGLRAALFGLVFAQQALAGFPQSAYICALVYGAFSLYRALEQRRQAPHERRWLMPLVVLAAAITLGAAAGAIVMLPMSQLGAVSDRAEALGWDWSTRLAYWPPNLIQFLFPYANGNIADNTYQGPPFFWEDYGYVGFFTVLVAIYGGVRDRRRPIVMFTIAMTIVGMLFVLGRATPVYHVAYLLIPGLKMFRFPTRFLIVVELGLALLAAFGLTRLRQDLASRARVAVVVPLAICALTALDLAVHQPRQNPMVPAGEWLAPPRAVEIVHADSPQPRTFTPRHRDFHRAAFLRASGWSDVRPYFEMRSVLEPNTGGGFWNTPSADCYAGINARWTTDVWGDHNREASLASMVTAVDFGSKALLARPAFTTLLRTYGVTHVLSPFAQKGASLTLLRQDPEALVYRVEGSARVRFVRSARLVASEQEAATRILDPQFDPAREVLLHDTGRTGVTGSDGPAAGTTQITAEGGTSIDLSVDALSDGYVVLADAFYPGWSATVDGSAAPLLRANFSSRAVAVPSGRHQIRMQYEAPGFATGWRVSAAALGILLAWLAVATIRVRRSPADAATAVAA
jgi:hypothetical protein